MAKIIGNGNANTLKGTKQKDVIQGKGGDDVINGKGGADRINAGGGDDLIIAGAGDTINGGSGTDTVRFKFEFDADTVSVRDGVWTIALDNGKTIKVSNVEVFEFGDVTLTESELSVWAENTAPTFDANLAFDLSEFAEEYDAVGTVAAVDSEGHTLSYSLTAGATSLFEIDSSTGQITVMPGAAFDYETLTTYSVTVTVTDDYGGETTHDVTINIADENDAPVISYAETSVMDGSNDANHITTSVQVTDSEGDWGGGEIRLTTDLLVRFGEFLDSGEGLTIAGGAGQSGAYTYSEVGGQIFATPVGGGDPILVGEIGGNSAIISLFTTYTALWITLTEDATDEIVTDLLHQIQIDGVVTFSLLPTLADVTVTITDGGGASSSFTRPMNSVLPTTINNLDPDDRDVAYGTLSGGTTIDDGGDADFRNHGLDLDGAEFTVSVDASDAEIDLTGAAGDYIVAGGALIRDNGDGVPGAGDTYIGTITGHGTNSVVVTFNSSATDADVDAILQAMSITSPHIGKHYVHIILENEGDQSAGAMVVLNGTVSLSDLTAASSGTPVLIDRTVEIEIDAGTDFNFGDAVADGAILVNGTHDVRLIFTASQDISGLTGLGQLGNVSIHALNGHTVTMTARQAETLIGAAVEGSILISNLHEVPDADLTGYTASGTLTAVVEENTTFTGNLGNFTVEVAAGVKLTGKAGLLGELGASHAITGAGNVEVTGLNGKAAYDLSVITATGNLTATIKNNPILHPDTDLGGFTLQVAKNSLVALSAEQADGRMINGTSTGTELVVVDLSSGTEVFDLSHAKTGIDGVYLYATDSVDLSGANLGKKPMTIWMDDNDNGTDAIYDVTLTAKQAAIIHKGAGSIINIGGDGEDGVRLITTEVTLADPSTQKGVTYAGTSYGDILRGTNGDDRIWGGKGADMIIGGAGKDVMTGGKGADTFVFADSGADSGMGKANRDVITDFSGNDTIAIDLGPAASFIGKSGFSGGGDAEVRFDRAGTKSIVAVDLDGDGAADFQIQLNGVSSLGADSFDFLP